MSFKINQMNCKNKASRQILYKAFTDTIPVMTGYIVLGMGFGILLRTRGYGIGWALGMSLFIYAGSMQYLTIDLLTGGVSLVAAALTTLLVNARHLFYGISMVDCYKNIGRKKPYLIFALTDETYSLVCGEKPLQEKEKGEYYFLVSLLNQIYWVTVSGVTIFLRFLPFWIFGGDKKTPKVITYLGEVLPYAIMGMLVVYCLRGVSFLQKPFGIPQLLAVALVAILHYWRRNTLLSILGELYSICF